MGAGQGWLKVSVQDSVQPSPQICYGPTGLSSSRCGCVTGSRSSPSGTIWRLVSLMRFRFGSVSWSEGVDRGCRRLGLQAEKRVFPPTSSSEKAPSFQPKAVYWEDSVGSCPFEHFLQSLAIAQDSGYSTEIEYTLADPEPASIPGFKEIGKEASWFTPPSLSRTCGPTLQDNRGSGAQRIPFPHLP